MDNYKQYRRSQIAELADWTPDFDMAGVSISEPDKANGSPKAGDKIARNPKNHADRWLVAAEYFAANFEPVYDPEIENEREFDCAAHVAAQDCVSVPREPTEAMIDAAFAATVWPDLNRAISSDVLLALRGNMRKEYRAMLAASKERT